MSRVRKAAITAGFAYAQFGVAIVTGIVMVPLTLHYVGARSWGLWLATGELLGYAGMADLGVLGVLPWMIAEADGRHDRAAMRRFVGHGVWIGAGAVITGRVRIGSGAVIGANSLVVSNLPENAMAIGVPARVLSYTGSAKLICLPKTGNG